MVKGAPMTNKLRSSTLVEELVDRSLQKVAVDQQSLDCITDFIFSHPWISNLFTSFSYTWKNKNLLVEALTHTSFVNENNERLFVSNERLEFFGDSIFNCLVSSYLMGHFPELNEGQLSRFRGAVVNEQSMAELSRVLDLGRCLLLGKGELKSNGGDKDALISDALEAFFGALYLDGGFEECFSFFDKLLELYERKNGKAYICFERLENFDPKSLLQEKTMALYKEIPQYKSFQSDCDFRVDLYIMGKKILSHEDKSKKKAEKFLAKEVLKKELYILSGENYVN